MDGPTIAFFAIGLAIVAIFLIIMIASELINLVAPTYNLSA
jgi:hypothetical protein